MRRGESVAYISLLEVDRIILGRLFGVAPRHQ